MLGSRAAAGGGAGLYRIIDGVRRAKAAEMLGLRSISAEVHIGGRVVQRLELSIDLLRSPRAIIDASTPGLAARFSEALEFIRAGTARPIVVTPGSTGLRIMDVILKLGL
jgi:hypothetical protein